MKWEHSTIGAGYFLGLTWAQALAAVCFWFCLGKNIINFVQLWKASKILVGVDLADRAKLREEAEQRRNAAKD